MEAIPLDGEHREAVLDTLRRSAWFGGLKLRAAQLAARGARSGGGAQVGGTSESAGAAPAGAPGGTAGEAADPLLPILTWGDLMQCPAGEVLIEQGFPSDSFYLLIRGTVAARIGPQGDREIGRLQAPANFGEIGLLLDEPRTATVVAIDDVLVLRFGASAFREMLDTLPGFGYETSRYLASRLKAMSERSI